MSSSDEDEDHRRRKTSEQNDEDNDQIELGEEGETIMAFAKIWCQFHQHLLPHFFWAESVLCSFSLITLLLCSFLAKEYQPQSCL